MKASAILIVLIAAALVLAPAASARATLDVQSAPPPKCSPSGTAIQLDCKWGALQCDVWVRENITDAHVCLNL